MTATLSIFRPSSWGELRARLDAAVTRDPSLAQARDILCRPVQLLELCAQDAPRALGDDSLAAERLRMVLHLAWPFAGIVEEAKTLLGTVGKEASVAYHPGVIDHGALLVVAVAALRVAPPGIGDLFLRTVHGLALSAASAEVLGRLDPAVPDGDALAILLNALYVLDAVGAAVKTPFLRPFATDPLERARWRALAELLDAKSLESLVGRAAAWDGAWSDGIDAVTAGNGDDHLTVIGTFKLPRDGTVVVVGNDQRRFATKVETRKQKGETTTLEVLLPAEVESGWIGFCDDERIEAANDHRQNVRKKLSELRSVAVLGGARVPIDRIPLIGHKEDGHLLSEPPRNGANLLARKSASRDGARYKSWASAESRQPSMAANIGADLPVVVVRPQVVDGSEVRAAIAPLDAKAFLEELGARHKLKLSVWELPWVDDLLAVLGSPLTSSDDARMSMLLEGLSRRAMLTPGFEAALWVLLLPPRPSPIPPEPMLARRLAPSGGVGAFQPAVAARAVVVADCEGLSELWPQLLTPSPKLADVGPRLRVLGSYDGAKLTCDSVEEESRAAGPGASVDVGLTAAAIDAADRELYVRPVKVMFATRPTQVAMLLPVSTEVAAIELRQPDGTTLARLTRTPGAQRLDAGPLDGEKLSWHYSHSRNVRPQVALWIATRAGLATPAYDLNPCDPDASRLPLHRFARVTSMWLTASDGWNRAEARIAGEVVSEHPLVLRRLSDGRYFADSDEPARWTLGGRDLGRGRTLALPEGASGMLVIESRGVVDWRLVGRGMRT